VASSGPERMARPVGCTPTTPIKRTAPVASRSWRTTRPASSRPLLLAFELAAAGDDAAAPAGSTADVVAAWANGTLHGGREFDTRMDLASERALLLDRMCGQDIPHGEWMEARIVPPV
jgi:hypothetical protein